MSIRNPMDRCEFVVEDYKCRCGAVIRIPIKKDYLAPLYVMQVERENRYIRDEVAALAKDVHALAKECLDFGMESTYLQRLSEINRKLLELMRRAKEGQGGD